MGMSGMPPRTHVAPAGEKGTGRNDAGYSSPHVSPSGKGDACGGVVAPGGHSTSKEMMGKMGQVPAPSRSQ